MIKDEVRFDPAMNIASSEWAMFSAVAEIDEVQYEWSPKMYEDMTFTFVQKRLSPHEL